MTRSGKSAFAIEFAGEVYAYLNSCPHLGVELDWAPGEFFDATGCNLVCSTHGAHFDPQSGRCLAGPCYGQTLQALKIVDEQGDLYI